ncbi:MAG: DNA polymerase III subunit beta [Gammaproteobacteria bacterium]|nr:DNA polymerase III subunit beta [Gammaproteobacteria bacterium]
MANILVISAGILAKGLTSVREAVGRKSDQPILEHVRLQADSQTLAITATNRTLEISARVSLENMTVFDTTMPAGKLGEIIRTLAPDAEVTLRHEGECVTMTSGRSRFKLNALDPSGFPIYPAMPNATRHIITGGVLFGLFSDVTPSMASNDTRPFSNCALLDTQNDQIVAVSTDGHRMALAKSEVQGALMPILIPRDTVACVRKHITDSESEIGLLVSNNHVQFDIGNITIRSALVDAKYPDYKRVIPSSHVGTAKVDRGALLESVKRAKIIAASAKVSSVDLEFSTGKVVLRSCDDASDEFEETLDAEYTDGPQEIRFQSQYLIDALEAAAGETITIRLSGDVGATILTGSGNPDTVFVIMPQRK